VKTSLQISQFKLVLFLVCVGRLLVSGDENPSEGNFFMQIDFVGEVFELGPILLIIVG
jgi:hypothetical protein